MTQGIDAMSGGITLAPCGLIVERIESDAAALLIVARPATRTAMCPACGTVSARVHSRYRRSLSDLPSQGRVVRIAVHARRFRCLHAGCGRKIFAERLETAVAGPFARRTARLEGLVQHLGLALGGRPGQSLARRLLLPVSNDTLLRVVRRHAAPIPLAPRVVGIDDWAWRRGHRYGTIVCDLERRRIVDLLPDREAATAAAWFARHPTITVVARDRGAGYKQAATEGRPEATQVADRWHLIENASAAFLDVVRRSMGAIQKALRAGPIDPAALTAAERRQHARWLDREAENAAILELAKTGMRIREIVRKAGRSRGLVRRVLRGGRGDVFRSRMSSLEPFVERLEAEWASGRRNGAALWRLLKAAGFTGALRVVTEWAARKRRGNSAPSADGLPHKILSARRIAQMMTRDRDLPLKTVTDTIAAIGRAVPDVMSARDLLDRFHCLVRDRRRADLDGWIADAQRGPMASFANGILQDKDAVAAALTEPWSNGQTEGQNTKLKLVKRQMYGRASLDLLRARLLGAN